MKQILIVDDSVSMREMLKNLLHKTYDDIEILEADSKDSALSIVKKNHPNLILLDTVMNGNELEGIETLKEIKQIQVKVNIIMLVPIGQTAIIEKCRKFGVLEYIQKPFDQSEVLKNTNKFLLPDKINIPIREES